MHLREPKLELTGISGQEEQGWDTVCRGLPGILWRQTSSEAGFASHPSADRFASAAVPPLAISGEQSMHSIVHKLHSGLPHKHINPIIRRPMGKLKVQATHNACPL